MFQVHFQAPHKEGCVWSFLLPYDFFMTDVLEKQTQKTAEEQPCQLQPGPFFINIGQASQNAWGLMKEKEQSKEHLVMGESWKKCLIFK